MFTTPIKKGAAPGFTLVEVIVSLAIMAFVAPMTIYIVSIGTKHIRSLNDAQQLTADAHFILDAFTYWTKQAKSVDVSAPSTLKVRLLDGSEKTFTASGDAIFLDTTPLTTNDTEVPSLTFTKLAQSVRIEFQLRSKRFGTTLPITTTVSFRNQ
ncbi:MAG: hypothetical protein A2667_01435 [Candidatus Wildermuthbacteria bacterium RIFCSPHIGHO2_01_FULL_47_27]|uniref:Prepilin-type N-terminal cleavage/methylation domain-containing protein n=2 Tax=Candidatus Wildermuthiibacteriota TaxID=1817923 RepID=A0A1G2RRE8_9BACT|nr:MAG: hypothetical protein UY15_C0012G0006 [Parcubacteria group bacterium GW2011_GWA2_47_9]OHA64253.1 MAG: hypothetical protein A2667_01435 [Candidatus Wildermuthbacteria bacterium RIFCSPHIGHO2_01_FULL_47_27]OHA67607.1 MAG: hypothetical protein A3D59_03505 [Candidatus Wildermuthbacteria bacterium RIFCSPHIGHO2_02_FULL_47_17]OHA75213.1 MAG: hypothetical protein A3I38_01540 [Candidatus Wildermuthbacteria bacterium RIFCSPLOWO2_02_FULL_47_10]OHA75455.1 MAG: hypothetical protein A3A32_02445 [Candid